jgi:hypothetical protein
MAPRGVRPGWAPPAIRCPDAVTAVAHLDPGLEPEQERHS